MKGTLRFMGLMRDSPIRGTFSQWPGFEPVLRLRLCELISSHMYQRNKMSTLIVPVFLLSLMTLQYPGQATEPLVILLWTNGAPGFEERSNEPELARDYWVRNIHNPSITVFLPPKEKANGAGVLICSGGGHRELVSRQRESNRRAT